MPFIGIIAKESDSNFIKNVTLKNAKSTKFEIININKKSIENMKNIKFDVIVINDALKDLLKNSYYLEEIIKNTKYLVINSDVVKNVEVLNSKAIIITYGLNQNATITMSSIKTENILICVQKKFKSAKRKMVEEQEVNIEITKNNLKKICNSMAVFSVLVIYGGKLQKI